MAKGKSASALNRKTKQNSAQYTCSCGYQVFLVSADMSCVRRRNKLQKLHIQRCEIASATPVQHHPNGRQIREEHNGNIQADDLLGTA